MFPADEQMIRVRAPGAIVLKMIENAVSAYPKLDGRFGNFAGISIKWDSRKEPYQRVLHATLADGSNLDLDKEYNIIV